jgi:hypothetical protein
MHGVDVQRAELRELNELNYARFDARFNELRHDMQAGFAQLESRIEAKIEQRTADLMKWSFVFWVGAVGAIAVLAGVLR